jgi:AcrR family transcriptional regulator
MGQIEVEDYRFASGLREAERATILPQMVKTPWGDASELRERRLQPGRAQSRKGVEESQRERIYAAMVAVASSRGYAQTRVAEVAELAGVSSRCFYELFESKEACLVAVLEEVLGLAEAAVDAELGGGGGWEERGGVVLGKLAELVAAQPASARLCLVEAFAAGAAARERVEEAAGRLALMLGASLAEDGGGEMPAELAWALVGGIALVIYRRLASGRPEEVAAVVGELNKWVISHPCPPGPLRGRARRGAQPAAGAAPPFAAHVPAERILRGFAAAVAEKGYEATTIADIAAGAAISQKTFYAHFEDKRDALRAALDSSGAQMVAAVLPAVRRSQGWPEAVQVALEACCGFLAAEPAFAQLREVEVYAVGPEFVSQRNRGGEEVFEVLRALSGTGGPEPLAWEATVGAISALFYRQMRRRGQAGDLIEAAPAATYLALAPLVGAERAYELACS